MDNFSPVGSCERSIWDKVLAVNLTGPFVTTKIAVAQMEKQSPAGGSIINIGSNASWRGMSAGVAYTVSKTGLLGLTKSTAGFYGPKGIYCQCLMLGGMADTNIAESMMAGGNFHLEMFQAVSETQNKVMKTVGLAGVAKYVLFLTDGDVAKDGNGGCVTYNGNWPEA
jgi:NAD(P)-dependent dehydrogenase (short-subunit alcohol dehydrogenase family)